jgi:hypothetical protein
MEPFGAPATRINGQTHAGLIGVGEGLLQNRSQLFHDVIIARRGKRRLHASCIPRH